MRAERTVFAEIDHRVLEALLAQQVRDPVRDVARRDSVERDGHAGRKYDARRPRLQAAEIY